jgi:hypothetical protein
MTKRSARQWSTSSDLSANDDRQAPARELVEHNEHAKGATILSPILDEVVGPDAVRTFYRKFVRKSAMFVGVVALVLAMTAIMLT